MFGKTVLFAVLVSASPAFAQVTADQLAKPPSDAKIWSITDPGGVNHGNVSLWTDASGTHWSRLSLNLRGFMTEVEEQNRFATDGSLESLIVRGFTPSGEAAETYTVKDGTYSYKTPVDQGTGKAMPGLDYVSFGGTFDSFLFILNDLLKSPNHSVNLLPSGRAAIAPLTTMEVTNGTEKKTLTAYAITGLGLSPFPV